jgi:hypothetical protein
VAIAADAGVLVLDTRRADEPLLVLDVPAATVLSASPDHVYGAAAGRGGGMLAVGGHRASSAGATLFATDALEVGGRSLVGGRSPLGLHCDGEAVTVCGAGIRGRAELSMWRCSDGRAVAQMSVRVLGACLCSLARFGTLTRLPVQRPQRVYAVLFDASTRTMAMGDSAGVVSVWN